MYITDADAAPSVVVSSAVSPAVAVRWSSSSGVFPPSSLRGFHATNALLLRNLSQVTIIPKAYYLLYIHIMVA